MKKKIANRTATRSEKYKASKICYSHLKNYINITHTQAVHHLWPHSRIQISARWCFDCDWKWFDQYSIRLSIKERQILFKVIIFVIEKGQKGFFFARSLSNQSLHSFRSHRYVSSPVRPSCHHHLSFAFLLYFTFLDKQHSTLRSFAFSISVANKIKFFKFWSYAPPPPSFFLFKFENVQVYVLLLLWTNKVKSFSMIFDFHGE